MWLGVVDFITVGDCLWSPQVDIVMGHHVQLFPWFLFFALKKKNSIETVIEVIP